MIHLYVLTELATGRSYVGTTASPNPLKVLWYHEYLAHFATTRLHTAMREGGDLAFGFQIIRTLSPGEDRRAALLDEIERRGSSAPAGFNGPLTGKSEEEAIRG